MNFPPPAPPLNRWLLALAAGLLALACNQFGLSVFGGTELLFGGWLVLLVAYAFGPVPGALAATVALIATPLAWGHPWGLITGVLEALAVGWAVQRRQWNPLRASLLFWAALGLPVAALGVMLWTTIPFPSNAAIVCKYAANSVLMTALTLPIHASRHYRRWLGLPVDPEESAPLHRVLFRRFGIIIGLTIATLAIFVGRNFDRTLRGLAAESLDHDAQELARDIALNLGMHQRALMLLATDAAPPPSGRLHALRANFPGFLTLLAADRAGRLVAASPEHDAEGRRLSDQGHSVADRSYFQVPMRTGRPYVSNVFRGRGFGADLIVALSVPIPGPDGAPSALVEGSLRLDHLLGDFAGGAQLAGRSVLVVDDADQSVVSTGAFAQDELAKLGPGPLTSAARRAAGHTFTLASLPGAPRENFLVTRAAVPGYGWHVYLAEPLWATQSTIAAYYLATFLAAGLAVALALLLARHTSREVTAPLGRLVTTIQALARSEPAPPAPPAPPAALELAQLSEAAHAAASTLSRANLGLAAALTQRDKTHQQLRQVLLHLDEKVHQRTQQLTEALRQAESASRAKSEFIASTSHELRTPLNGVLGLSEILLDQSMGPLNDEQASTLRMIEESGRHLLSLINDILDLAKIEAGKFDLERQEAAIADVCEASLRLVAAGAEKKQQQLRLDLRATSPALVADVRRLKQILVNLLGNAVKFTPPGGAITLAVTETAAPPEVHFSVIDTGIGIAPEDLGRLFERFQQLDGNLNRRHAGTGLGLVLVRRMTELHGGRVAVESQPGAGSRFTVSLPLAGTAAPAPPETGEPRLGTPPPLPAGTRVLIAEDNEMNRRIYERSAFFSRCRLIVAHHGLEAVRLATAEPPDLILMDVQMPEMDGLEATRRLRAHPATAQVPIIVITAAALPEDRARCLEAGATFYQTKPVDLRALARDIVEALASSPR